MNLALVRTARPLLLLAALSVPAGWASAAELPAVPATAAGAASPYGFDGVVEAVRQTVVAAQVQGAVVELKVKAGDRVAAGQLLLRIDARAAEQAAAASDAQAQSVRASLALAKAELGRQQQLFKQNYISAAALDRAEAEFKATEAQLNAQLAQAGAARTQTAFHIVRAPYAGVVAEVPVTLGDMALPGRALVTVYDPAALRITASVPQSVAVRLAAGTAPRVELPGLASPRVTPTRWQVLPTADAATHTVLLRAELPAGLAGVAPGQFARLWLPLPASAGAAAAVSVPAAAVVRRAEMTGLYVLTPEGKPLLRQVRLGREDAGRVEVLSGLAAGERVVTDPQAAARVR